MKILFNKSCCKVVFEENEKYSGKTLIIDGEWNLEKEFCVYKNRIHEMCWTNSVVDGKRFAYVNAELRNEVLSHVIEEAKKQGYSIVLW